MNCPWCGLDDGSGSHNICDDCMQKFFGVDPASIHAEIAAEDAKKSEKQEGKVAA